MPTLDRLDTDRLRTLQIVPPREDEAQFQFYELCRGPYYDEWDVVGLHRITTTLLSTQELLLNVHLMHIEQEMVETGWGHEDAPERPFFNALEESGGYVHVSPDELALVIDLLER
jgi:hypothetical protein